MHKYIIRRLLLTVVVVLGVTLLTFLSIHLAGDPTFFYVSERASAEERQAARERLGFDRPLHIQYFDFLFNLARGDTGNSLAHRVPAFDVVMERMPATLELTIGGFLLSTIVAFPIGVLAATRRGTMTDGTLMLGAMLGQSMPSFWLGLMLIIIFSVYLRILPSFGALEPQAIIMPSSTLGVGMAARLSRLTRSAMLEVLNQDYVRTAHSKGLQSRQVVLRHALRNALIPVVTVFGLQLGWLLGGSVVVESVFAWPGLGRLMVESINVRDTTVVQAGLFWFSLSFILINYALDAFYMIIDPRIRIG